MAAAMISPETTSTPGLGRRLAIAARPPPPAFLRHRARRAVVLHLVQIIGHAWHSDHPTR